MSLNTVTVTVAAQAGPSDTAPEGNFVFSPNGTMWPTSAGQLPIVPYIQHGSLVNGTASVVLVASDNFAANVLNWDVIINIRGLPTVVVSALPVLFSLGASQSIWDILVANAWTPTVGMMGGTVAQD